jgi:hypothetical protein
MACERCPCPETCLAWPIFCEWAKAVPPDPARLDHIRLRSGLGAEPIPDTLPPAYPPPARQAANLAGAAARAVAAAVKGERVLAPADLVAARRALCLPCEHNGERATGGIRCTKCGCGGAKLHLATESCPAGKW